MAGLSDMQLAAAHITAPEANLAPHLPGGVETARALGLVLGSEGQGLSARVLEDCKPVAIPMPGGMESLNVAIAGGILMYILRPHVNHARGLCD